VGGSCAGFIEQPVFAGQSLQCHLQIIRQCLERTVDDPTGSRIPDHNLLVGQTRRLLQDTAREWKRSLLQHYSHLLLVLFQQRSGV
jgi:hypothetical protein